MGQVIAKGSIRPRALQRTLSAARREFGRVHDEWQSSYPGFKERLPGEQRTRLKEIGRLLWCFDIRFRWATGITEIAIDDEIVTTATSAPTREGYFLLMRLVDLWFCCDLAFDMYKRLIVPSRITNPNFLVQIKDDQESARPRLRAVRAASEMVKDSFGERIRKPAARERFAGYLEGLAREAEGTVAGDHIAYASRDFQRGNPLKPHHLAAIAQGIRNRYVHGGETASTRNFSAQEKAPLLRLLCGYVQIVALDMTAVAGRELCEQLRKHACG